VAGAAVAAIVFLRAPAPGDALEFVPAGTRTVIAMPDVAAFHTSALSFLASIEGADGVLDLASAEVGVDLTSLESLTGYGVASEGSVALFHFGSSWVLNVSVSSLSQFEETVSRRALSGLGGVSRDTSAAPPGLTGAARLASGLGLAWGSTRHRGVARILLAPSVDDVEAVWKTLDETPNAPVAEAPAEGLVWCVADAKPEVPASLGPAALVLSSYVTPLSRWVGTLGLGEQGMSVALDGIWQGRGAPPLAFFHTQPQGQSIRSYVPRATTGLFELSWQPRSVSAMPAFIRSAILPTRLPGLAGAVLPPTGDLLELLHGDLAMAVFGLSKDRGLAPVRMPTTLTELMTQTIGVGFFVRAADGGRVAGVLAGVAEGLAARGWTVTPITQGPWLGFDLHTQRPEQRWSLVARDDVAALVTASELPHLVAVAKGEETPHLASHKKANDAPTFGLHVSFGRIARELATRGVPPYFLTIMSGLDSAGVSARLHEDGVRLTVEVGL